MKKEYPIIQKGVYIDVSTDNKTGNTTLWIKEPGREIIHIPVHQVPNVLTIADEKVLLTTPRTSIVIYLRNPILISINNQLFTNVDTKPVYTGDYILGGLVVSFFSILLCFLAQWWLL